MLIGLVPKRCFGAPCWHHLRVSVGHRYSDHPVVHRHHGVVAGNTEMVRVRHRHGADAGCVGLFDGAMHRPGRNHDSEAVVAVKQDCAGRLADDACASAPALIKPLSRPGRKPGWLSNLRTP